LLINVVALLSHPSQLINTLQLIYAVDNHHASSRFQLINSLAKRLPFFVVCVGGSRKDTIFRYKLFDLLSGLMSYSMFRGSHPYALGCKPSTFFIFFLRCAK